MSDRLTITLTVCLSGALSSALFFSEPRSPVLRYRISVCRTHFSELASKLTASSQSLAFTECIFCVLRWMCVRKRRQGKPVRRETRTIKLKVRKHFCHCVYDKGKLIDNHSVYRFGLSEKEYWKIDWGFLLQF